MEGLPLAPSPRHISNSSLSHKTQSLILYFAVWILRSSCFILLGEAKFWHRGVFYHYSLIIFIMVFLVIVFDGFYIWLMSRNFLVLVFSFSVGDCVWVLLCLCLVYMFVYASVCVDFRWVLMCLCVYVCMGVCLYVWLCLCVCLSVWESVSVCKYLSLYTVFVFVYLCLSCLR